MLVLTRKVGERVLIGDDVEVIVVGVRDGKAVIGIAAPKEVGVRRGEVERGPECRELPTSSAAGAG